MNRVQTTAIRQIEFELHKAEHGMGMPYDSERVIQLRQMPRRRASGSCPTGWRPEEPRTAVNDDNFHDAARQRPLRRHRSRRRADEVQVARRGPGLVPDPSSRIADHGGRPWRQAAAKQRPKQARLVLR
jgi:hypothetical protein